MFIKTILLFLCLQPMLGTSGDDAADFMYNGFRGSNVGLNGVASITPEGLLKLTNSTEQIGRAFYPASLQLKNHSNGKAISFSTTFVFAMVNNYTSGFSTDGLAFVISNSKEFQGAVPGQFLGLFNSANNSNLSNPVVAVEFDTIQNFELKDTDNNHVGIDINSLISNKSVPAAYYTNSGSKKNIGLASGESIQVWIEYSGEEMKLNVTISPIDVPKPAFPLLSEIINISDIILDTMYAGFSASTGPEPTTHYMLGWSFNTNGRARELDISSLPRLPQRSSGKLSKALTIGLPVIVTVLVLLTIASIILVRRNRFTEVLEDWEREYGPHRFSYRDLFMATDGFKEKGLLGVGGFGQVYKGLLKASKIEVAVKRMSHNSRQGMREFVAEIVSLGRLRHRNLVQLLGYCRRKGELQLVYEFMPNGSLDSFLFDNPKSMLNWSQRFHILKGVASGLLYLHEGWEQVVVHRDIKASNVLLDSELNGKLGDFGLARLYDHGSNARTTNLVGTMGYIAPELTRTGKATTMTDVFAFGAFMLEVVCGRRPLDSRASPEKMILLDWVLDCWRKGAILEAADPKLGGEYVVEEVELVLKLGLLCAHQIELARPCMRLVLQFLEGDSPSPELPLDSIGNSTGLAMRGNVVDIMSFSTPTTTPRSLYEGR